MIPPIYLQSVSLVLALLLNAQVCLAQSTPAQHQVRIILTDATRHPIFGATVQQQLWPDTTQTSTTISDTAGVALLPVKPDTSYRLRISALGYQPIEQGIRPTKNDVSVYATIRYKDIGYGNRNGPAAADAPGSR